MVYWGNILKVLVTGSSGLLGRSLGPALKKEGHSVTRHSYSSCGDITCDLTNRANALELLDRVRPSVVVNLVALADVDECESNIQRAFLLNYWCVENLVAGLQKNSDAHLIHISTDQVYDGRGLNTEDNVHISNIYALTKYAGEIAAMQSSTTVLRTNFFGISRHPNRDSFSDSVLRKLQSGEAMTGFSDVFFNPLSISTLCDMIGHVVKNPINGVFNLGSRAGISKYEFILKLANVYGLDAKRIRRGLSSDLNLNAYRPKDMRMDCRRFENAFGVKLPSLGDEIKRMKSEESGDD